MKYKFHQTLLAKLCLFHSILVVGSTACQGQQVGMPVAEVQLRDPGRLPNVPTVESMLRPDPSIERFLSRTPLESAYERASYLALSRTRTTDDQTRWNDTMAGWTAAELYTNPLYFEQINFERYETSAPAWTRPVVSYAQFLGTIPVLPYKLGANGPRNRIYTVGHYPYGQVPPSHSHWGKPSKRGALLQGIATTGLIFFIP